MLDIRLPAGCYTRHWDSAKFKGAMPEIRFESVFSSSGIAESLKAKKAKEGDNSNV